MKDIPLKPEVMKKVMELAGSLPEGSSIEIGMPQGKKGKKGKCPHCGQMMGEDHEEEEMSTDDLRDKLKG